MAGNAPLNEATQGNAAATTVRKSRGRPFVKGQPSANPAGRPKGSRNKLCGLYIESMQAAFLMASGNATLGQAAIEKVAKKHPGLFLKLIADLVPKEFDLGDKTAGGFRELWTALGHGKLPPVNGDKADA